MLSKKEFMEEVEVLLHDVRTRQECKELWDSSLIAYIDDGLISKSALRWKNPFVNRYGA